tara:strand:- start:125 stop:418 length:294 start_codon:yes stop_codon:yes gene_type:complete
MVEEMIKHVYKLNEDELTQIVLAIKDRRDGLRYDKLRDFKVGDKVSWSYGKGTSKEFYTGEVFKINSKTVAVRESGRAWSRWRISPSMLTKIEGDES